LDAEEEEGLDGCEACEGLEEEACDGLGGGVEREPIHTPMAYAMDNSNLLHALQEHSMGLHKHSTCPRTVVPTRINSTDATDVES